MTMNLATVCLLSPLTIYLLLVCKIYSVVFSVSVHFESILFVCSCSSALGDNSSELQEQIRCGTFPKYRQDSHNGLDYRGKCIYYSFLAPTGRFERVCYPFLAFISVGFVQLVTAEKDLLLNNWSPIQSTELVWL